LVDQFGIKLLLAIIYH